MANTGKGVAWSPALCQERHRRVWQVIAIYVSLSVGGFWLVYHLASEAWARSDRNTVRLESLEKKIDNFDSHVQRRFDKVDATLEKMSSK